MHMMMAVLVLYSNAIANEGRVQVSRCYTLLLVKCTRSRTKLVRYFFCVLHCLEASPYRWKAEWQALPLSAGVSSDVFLLGCIGRCFGAWQEEPRTIITNARMAVACSDKPVCAIPIIVSYYHHTTFPVYLCSKHWSNISYDTLSVLWC